MMRTTKAEIHLAAQSLARKIGEAGRLYQGKTGKIATTADLLKNALGVNTVNNEQNDTPDRIHTLLTVEEVAQETRLSVFQVKEAVREYMRTAGLQGIGPFYQFGRRRRFPRAAVERWKQEHLVMPKRRKEGVA